MGLTDIVLHKAVERQLSLVIHVYLHRLHPRPHVIPCWAPQALPLGFLKGVLVAPKKSG